MPLYVDTSARRNCPKLLRCSFAYHLSIYLSIYTYIMYMYNMYLYWLIYLITYARVDVLWSAFDSKATLRLLELAERSRLGRGGTGRQPWESA